MVSNITKNAKVIASLGLVAGILLTLFAPKFWISGLALVLGFFVVAYNVNCVLVGKCIVWGMFLTVLYSVYAVMLLLLIFFNKKGLIKAMS